MSTYNPYAGTILENTYSPVVFEPIIDDSALYIEAGKRSSVAALKISAISGAAATILPVSLPASLAAGLATGVAVSFTPKKRKKGGSSFEAAEILETIAPPTIPSVDILERIFKTKELKEISKKYDDFVKQTDLDFDFYKYVHEDYLQSAMGAVEGINRRKVLMKDYLLLELSEQLKRSGLNGRFSEPKIERLDPRVWPINQAYALNLKQNHEFIEYSLSFVPIFDVGRFLMIPIVNRNRIRLIRNALEQLKPVAELNLEQMLSDLVKLDLFSAALVNIDTIYKEVLDRLRPIMKGILKDLEDKYQGNVKRMPGTQADALYTIKTLFKDLAETTIVPRSENNQEIYSDVCDYSNTLSDRYNTIRETIYKNFCN